MTLKIQNSKSDTTEIYLIESALGVSVHIDGEQVAHFKDDGEFEFYGKTNCTKYHGRWDNK